MATKSTIKEYDQQNSPICLVGDLLIEKTEGFVVIVTDPETKDGYFEGAVVHADPPEGEFDSIIGEYNKWNRYAFKPFEGEVILKTK